MTRSTRLHHAVQDTARITIGEAARRLVHRIAVWASSIEPGTSHRMGAWELHASNLAREVLARRR